MPRVSGAVAIVALIVNYIISLMLPAVVPAEHLHTFTYGGIALFGCLVFAFIGSLIAPNKRDTTGLTHFSRPKAQE
jgi:hypothetical protein